VTGEEKKNRIDGMGSSITIKGGENLERKELNNTRL